MHIELETLVVGLVVVQSLPLAAHSSHAQTVAPFVREDACVTG